MVYVDMLLNQTTVEVPECAEGCINGRCVPPGLCACTKGWVGANCTVGRLNELCNVLLTLLKCRSGKFFYPLTDSL